MMPFSCMVFLSAEPIQSGTKTSRSRMMRKARTPTMTPFFILRDKFPDKEIHKRPGKHEESKNCHDHEQGDVFLLPQRKGKEEEQERDKTNISRSRPHEVMPELTEFCWI